MERIELAQRVINMKESDTIRMAQLARDLTARGRTIINLSLGEPDFDTPAHIKKAAMEALEAGYTKYSPVPGVQGLREAIRQKFKRDNQLDYKVSQIVVSNGAKQSLANLSMALLNPGDEVIIFAPYWVSYFEIVRIGQGTPVVLQAGIEQDFKVTPAQLAEALTEKTKAILFSSPCNPTGSVYTSQELEGLAEVIRQHPKALVISDEIYEYINFSGHHSSIAQARGMKERTVVVNGFSKGFAMTGWRLGYMAAPQPIADACTKIQGQFTSGANTFAQMAAIEALNADLEPTREMNKAFAVRKNMVRDLLREIPGLRVNDPKGAFYIFPDISSFFGQTIRGTTIGNATDFCEYLLEEAGVALVAGDAFGAPNCFRISFAASEEDLRKAIHLIKNALSTDD